MTSKLRSYSAALKAQLVLDVLTGHRTVSSACRQRGVSEPLFYEWQAEFMANGARVFAKEEELAQAAERIAALERLVGQLLLELEGAKTSSPGAGYGNAVARRRATALP